MMISTLSSQLAYLADDKQEWPLQVTCFGAQGGASSSKQPGSISYVCASLYLGYAFRDGVQTPLIALCSQGGHYTFKASTAFTPNKAFDSRVEPRDNELLQYFIEQREHLVVDEIHVDSRYLRQEEASITKGMSIKNVVALLLSKYKDSVKGIVPEVTGTSNWFIGGEQKQAFTELGVTGCNMEDYWVLRSMRRCALERVAVEPRDRSMYPVFARGFLTRVNADPLRIEDNVAEAFLTDMSRKYLSRQGYVELLRWGLKGLPLTANGAVVMPDVAQWSFAKSDIFKEDRRLFTRHLYGVLVQGSEWPVVPDPFYIEIASDLLKGCAGFPGSVDSVFANAPASTVLDELRDAARLALTAWNEANGAPSTALDRALEAFVDVLADKAGFNTSKGLKVWLRPKNKWPGIHANSIQDLGEQRFGHAAVDRAFYKSCNLIALQEHTSSVLR
jgi:hypothetical protein